MKINELASLAPGFVQAPTIVRANTQQFTVPEQDVEYEKAKSANKETPIINLKDVNGKATDKLDDYTDEQKPEVLSKKISDLLFKLDQEINIKQIGQKPEPQTLSNKIVKSNDLLDKVSSEVSDD